MTIDIDEIFMYYQAKINNSNVIFNLSAKDCPESEIDTRVSVVVFFGHSVLPVFLRSSFHDYQTSVRKGNFDDLTKAVIISLIRRFGFFPQFKHSNVAEAN